ncbi:Hypothetical protein TON_1148 [Thermococcus onnurineus NA1]|uniref:DUF2202 domain-containing protein n=1 Tax=Thermococcus onnurineus (strain NA1) TaxID=523850 RepID=B6YX23_THEON|nr:DUF2202 domain-containing protein [Thermococcus onnurineus]ACJ16636.1 Hypothetical protein TON_1148 [Thermococcus onnurineus NA1]
MLGKKAFGLLLMGVLLLGVFSAGCITTDTATTTTTETVSSAATQTYGSEAAPRGPPSNVTAGSFVDMAYNVDYIYSLPTEELTLDEIQAILYMREEEKLARDVYLTLYDKWGIPIFNNIARSEQMHMDMVLALIEKYNLTDPAEGKDIGEFTNPEIQALYDQLIEQGLQSEEAALKVGALIEEVDIKDLQEWLAKTDNEDIKYVFENLMMGSRNHLRAFTNVLSRQYGITYEPQILPQDEYEAVVSSPMETGMSSG